MKETTRVRGRWDHPDSISNRPACGIFLEEYWNPPIRLDKSGVVNQRATPAPHEEVLALMTAMNETSSDVPSSAVTPMESVRMKTTTPVEVPAINSGATESLGVNATDAECVYRSFKR